MGVRTLLKKLLAKALSINRGYEKASEPTPVAVTNQLRQSQWCSDNMFYAEILPLAAMPYNIAIRSQTEVNAGVFAQITF